jgi:hypothetical protein
VDDRILAFVGISIAVVVIPGPDMALGARNVIRHGRSAGFAMAAIALGPRPDVLPPNHLGPHNVFEWVLYLGVIAVFVILVVYEVRSLDGLPRSQEPHDRNARSGKARSSETPLPTPGSDESFDERDAGP